MDALVARPRARATACATGHHQRAWSRQVSEGNGPAGGGTQLQGHSCVPMMATSALPPLTGGRQRTSNRLLSYRRSLHRSQRVAACAAAAFRTSASAGGNLPLFAAAARTNWQYLRRRVRAMFQHYRAVHVANGTVRPSARKSGAFGRRARCQRATGVMIETQKGPRC
eukprot:359994-Chlamydomonas_euryale.AAC.1